MLLAGVQDVTCMHAHTSMTVPLVMTPSCVYEAPLGFFFTPRMSRQKVHFSSGCVTCAFFMRSPAHSGRCRGHTLHQKDLHGALHPLSSSW